MDLVKAATEIFNGALEVAKKYLLTLLIILGLGIMFVAGYMSLDIIERALQIAIDLINSVQGLVN